jgi:threonine/homoserine/homoserine lactone efflux protein
MDWKILIATILWAAVLCLAIIVALQQLGIIRAQPRTRRLTRVVTGLLVIFTLLLMNLSM